MLLVASQTDPPIYFRFHTHFISLHFAVQVQTWAQQQSERIQVALSALETEKEEVQRLLDWISSAEESINLKEQEPLPDDTKQSAELILQHAVLHIVTYILALYVFYVKLCHFRWKFL